MPSITFRIDQITRDFTNPKEMYLAVDTIETIHNF